MTKLDTNTFGAFFALLRAGLWEKSVELLPLGELNFDALYNLASEQAVIGLVAAGLEHVSDRKITKPEALQFMKTVFSLEGRNTAMNLFLGELTAKMRKARIYAILVKGQGVGQCYERPLWRSSGDVDFFLDKENYSKAKAFLTPLSSDVDSEDRRRLHLGMTIDTWTVELHGTMHTEISHRVNMCLDAIQRNIFVQGNVRAWNDNGVDIILPAPTDDAMIIFSHFIQHFFDGGIGLRQICDWCRLLWFYREQIDKDLLWSYLKDMGLVSEWRAFGFFSVSCLGMPQDAMPFYKSTPRLSHLSKRICRLIIKTGNLGQNINEDYRGKYPMLIEKSITFWRRFWEFAQLSTLFPLDAPKFFLTYVVRRTRATFSK